MTPVFVCVESGEILESSGKGERRRNKIVKKFQYNHSEKRF